MTAQEALDNRIPRIRKPVWANPNAYMRLPLMEKGYGPWAELYDDRSQEMMEIRPGSQLVLVLNLGDDKDWEVYSGPISPHEKEGYAKVYLES